MPSDPSAPTARRPVRIGKYEVLSHIATGGMGAVYKARDVELRREVALKILPPELAAKPALLERFKREAIHAARLRHENIVTLFECGEVGGTHYLALEFVQGIDLGDYIDRNGKLDPEEARIISLQAARALDHAHHQGIIHRDIKPSNFLLSRPKGGLLVKMTDFGLARVAGDEDFRVTRAGTTVGTIDYISPEQARDSALADIRSDLYSLGCTLFHMLAGRAPFADGGLTERLYKHIEEKPPNVLDFNPRVSPELCAVLYKLLAKKPEDRYQTPAELLDDLLHLDRVTVQRTPVMQRDVLAELAASAIDEMPAKSSERRSPPLKPKPIKRRHAEVETAERTAAKTRAIDAPRGPKPWLLGGSVVALVALVVVGVLIAWRLIGKTKTPDSPDNKESTPIVEGPSTPTPPSTESKETKKDGIPPPGDTIRAKPPIWPSLYESGEAPDAERLNREFEGSWPAPMAAPADAPVFRVSRVPRGGGGPHYDSLAVACAAAPEQRLTVIEIHDNGPIYSAAVAVKNRSLVLRPGPDYRPLLVWDVTAGERDNPLAPRADAFLTVSQGNLTMENLGFAVKRDGVAEAAAFARVLGGDLLARGCTFSAAGKQCGPVAAARIERPDGGGAPHCRFSNCFGRGGQLQIADVRGQGANILLDGCLFVGGEAPLFRVEGFRQTATDLRVAHSTLIGAQTLLQVRSASAEDVKPAVHWQSWDSVLSRSADQTGGTLLALDDNAAPGQMKWKAENCCFAGWKTLLGSAETIAATDPAAWGRLWGYRNGVQIATDAWPAGVVHDPAEALPDAYRPAPFPQSPVGYAATTGNNPIGCDPANLPLARDNWVSLTYDRFVLPSLDMLRGGAPEISSPFDGGYHGERLDLSRVDLGAYLKEVQQSRKLGPKVVLVLTGGGERKCSPIRWKGASLVLYVEPPAEGTPPLSFLPQDPDPTSHAAWIEVEEGSLDLIGVDIRCPDFKLALLPPHLIQVKGGNLRTHGCRIQGPRQNAPAAFRGLIHLEGSGQSTADKAAICALHETVLVSGRNCVQTTETGARLALEQCVLVAGGEAISFEPRASKTKPNLSCELYHCTVAAQAHVLHLGAVAGHDMSFDPLVVRADACAFLAPFAGQRSGQLRCDGDTLARGLLIWQGEGNVFDKRLHAYVVIGEGASDRPQALAIWSRLWGPMGERQPITNLTLTNALKWEALQLERLLLPEIKGTLGGNPKPHPGADLIALGLVAKSPKSPK
jgi:eukaryotic-like serine/threonine-protein kinase